MSCEQTLAGCEQSVKSLEVAKVEFIFHSSKRKIE